MIAALQLLNCGCRLRQVLHHVLQLTGYSESLLETYMSRSVKQVSHAPVETTDCAQHDHIAQPMQTLSHNPTGTCRAQLLKRQT